MFKGRIVFTNSEEAPTQHFQHQQHSGGLAPQGTARPPAVLGGFELGPTHRQAGAERYVRTVSYTETSTNDTTVNLQKAADRQLNNNSTTLNLIIGCVFAAVAGKVFFPLLETSVKVFGAIVIAAFVAGFFMLKGQLDFSGKGGNRGSH